MEKQRSVAMDLSNVGSLDSIILLGIVNEKLRLECNSFDELVSLSENAKRFALLGDAAISMAVIYHLWQTEDDVGNE